MKNFQEDTIAAISTALGEGAVGIVRLSGAQSLTVANSILDKVIGKRPRYMEYAHVLEGSSVVDEVLAVYMKAPHSYTAEDVVEIQCHGGVAALKKILSLCLEGGARLAEPGEFTKRAFLNGRLDLTQAEAVMDIIRAKSQKSLEAAQRTRSGALSRKIRGLRSNLIDVVVQLEAKIDYPEEDIEDVTYEAVGKSIAAAQEEVQQLLASAHTGRILREGLRVAIVGRPNVGKSSLLNALLEEERAIVSDYAGTTRDVIEEQLLLEGVPVVLCDTAGIRATGDAVEQIGVEKSRSLLAEAELVLCVLDGSSPLLPEDESILQGLKRENTLLVLNKQDLPCLLDRSALKGFHRVELSSKTGAGLQGLKDALYRYAYQNKGDSEGVYVQNVRHGDLLRQAQGALGSALTACTDRLPYDCITIDVKNALSNLGEITGDQVTEEIINKIFEKFCIGK